MGKGFDRGFGPTYTSRRMFAMAWKGTLLLGAVGVVLMWGPGRAMAVPDDESDGETNRPSMDGSDAPSASGPEAPATDVPGAEASERDKAPGRHLGFDSEGLGDFGDAEALPIGEKIAIARQKMSDEQKALESVSALLRTAMSASDYRLVNCIQPKLTGIQDFIQLSQTAFLSLSSVAPKQGAPTSINGAFTQILIAHRRCMQFLEAARECSSDLSEYTGETEVEVEVDSNAPKGEPGFPVEPPVGPEFPALASSF